MVLTIVVCERHEAPVFSFYTLVDAGSAQDPKGETGMAHMFEHMAFKGTTTIGTTDYEAEKSALEKEEAAYQALQQRALKRVGQDPRRLKNWRRHFTTPKKMPTSTSRRMSFARSSKARAEQDLNATTGRRRNLILLLHAR